ncbi:hypothetical protein LPJ73_006787, partial [Coemansia sp. RSA 2703]
GVLQLTVTKGRDIPRTTLSLAFSQYIHVRVTSDQDYCRPVVNTDGAPRFHMTSYFTKDLYSNALIEITLCNDGIYVDRVAGRVSIPLKELHDVRSFHGWVALEGRGGPAGFVYLESKMRLEGDGEYKHLLKEAEVALGKDGAQTIRARKGRSRDRETARNRVNKPRDQARYDDSSVVQQVATGNEGNTERNRGLRGQRSTQSGSGTGRHSHKWNLIKRLRSYSARPRSEVNMLRRRESYSDEELAVDSTGQANRSQSAATVLQH